MGGRREERGGEREGEGGGDLLQGLRGDRRPCSASYIVASASKKILGLGLVLTLSGLGRGLGLMPSWPR